MIKINIRSPYIIEINESGQDGSKIEVFIWNKGTSEPSIPQHTISKPKVSSLQTANYYNVSDYAKEYINPIAPVIVATPTEESTSTWCYLRVKRYKLVGSTYTLLDSTQYVCLNGFTSFLDGLNSSTSSDFFALSNTNVRRYLATNNSHYFNVWLGIGYYAYDNSDISVEFIVSSNGLWKIPILGETNITNTITTIKVLSETICEPIYTPVVCSFVNRFGGWEFITFFKNSIDSFTAESKDYNLNQADINYNIQIGKKKNFNQSLKQNVKLNTGFVPEGYSELIRDLIVSDVVLLDGKPAIIKSTSFEKKTHLKDNNINYELEFEYNYNLINDMI